MEYLRAAAVVCVFTVSAFSSVAAQGQEDGRIVPGERVGRIALGMNAADLYRALGEPLSTKTYTDGVGYGWNGIKVTLNRGGVVTMIQTTSPNYSLADGLAVGASQLALQAKRAGAAWSRTDGDETKLCYNDGLIVWVSAGKVIDIQVNSRGCR